MKNLLLLTVAILLISCESRPSHSQKDNITQEDFQKVAIDFLDMEMLIPSNYEPVTLSEVKEKMMRVERKTEFMEILNNQIANVELMIDEFRIFADKEHIENCMWIYAGDYVDFNKRIASQYLGMVEEQMRQEWSPLGIDYKRLEQQFIRTGRSKFIKIKYQLTLAGDEQYHTQYVVSSNYRTFAIIVINSQNIDFEELVRRI